MGVSKKKEWNILSDLIKKHIPREEVEDMLKDEEIKKLQEVRERKLAKIREASAKNRNIRSTEVLLGHIIRKHMGALPYFGVKEKALIKKLLNIYNTEQLEEMMEFAFTNPQLYFNYRNQYTKVGGIVPFWDNHLLIFRNMSILREITPPVSPLSPSQLEDLSPALRKLRLLGEKLKNRNKANNNDNQHT